MAKVFGSGSGAASGNGGTGRVLPTSQEALVSSQAQSFSSNPNVYSKAHSATGEVSGDCGISRVLPTSQEALASSQTQSFSSNPNVYSKTRSATGEASLQDFYTKSEVRRLLRTKADLSSVYARTEVDTKLADLESEINASLDQFISSAEVDNKISDSYDSVLSYLTQNYYVKSQLYTRAQIDTLIDAIEVGGDFISKQPTSTVNNTISPGANEAVPLTLVASSDPDITTIQHWIDDQSNSVGRIRKSGRVEFYSSMILGQNVEAWNSALDVNQRRISGVGDPIHVSDAVNKKYMEDFVVETFTDIVQGEDGIYLVDAQVY